MSTTLTKKTRGSKIGPESLGRKTSAQQSSSLWPEWSDAEVNAEKWGQPRPGPQEKGKGKQKPSSPKSAKSPKSDKSAGTKGTAGTAVVEEEQFEDPFSISLPWSLKTECTWIRPQALVDPKVRLLVFSPTSPFLPDLVTNNRGIFQSPLIRAIVSAVHMLAYIGQTRPFTIEWQSPLYTANTEGLPWKPWHHIYSLSKAGKGQSHNPTANTMGKYVVRLFWLGCWRKFIVDDRYPVATNGRWLLPVSNISTSDKEFELWPMLLTKALLKIASLTWTDKKEIVDFDVVTCLTGWAVQKIFTNGMDMQDIWEVCCAYSDHYTWDQRLILGPFEEPANEAMGGKTGKSASKKDKSTKASSKGSGSSKSGKNAAAKPPRSFHLTASCTDLRTLEEDAIEDLTPCFQHDFLIEETRNIPLINKIPEYDRNIAAWKEYRWVDWAVAHGLWDRVYDWEIFKCIRMISGMRKVDDVLNYDQQTTDREKLIRHSVTIIDEFVERKKQEKLTTGAKGKKDKKADSPKKDKASTSSKKENKGGKKTKEIFIDTSIWNDFGKIAPYITCVSVYLKPSSFKMNYVITDIQFSAASVGTQKKPAKDKKAKGAAVADENSIKYIYLENVVMKSRNEPIYFFTDSIDFKLTMFSLAHLGNNPPKPDWLNKIDEVHIDCKKLVCKLNKCDDECVCQKVPSAEVISEKAFVDTRKYAHIIVEDYQWKSHSLGEQPVCLKTCGYSSVLLDLEKGRHVKRIWIEGNSPYVLFIFCDTDIKVGNIDEILDSMVEESEMVTQTCYNICSSFGKLIRYFGFVEYPLALRQFYKSYMPVVNLSKKKMSLFHDSFQKELITLLAILFPIEKHYDISRAFRILLLNPNFRIPRTVQKKPYEPTDDTVCVECPCDDIDGKKLRENSAIKIQSFFKMIYMKKLKSLQDPYNKKFQPVVDVLKIIYQNVFSSKVRPINIDLLRSLAINKNLQSLVQYFPFYRDLHYVIVIKQFSGEANDVPENSWVPLLRREFFCETSDAIFIRAYLFCSLAEYMLRIFNNDTGKEIDRYINNALGCKYEKNENGYTILAYGWTNEYLTKKIYWKLYVVIDKILNTCPVEIGNSKNITSQIRGNYVPNLDGLISKCKLKIEKSCLGTFHFEVSSPTAKIKIQLLNKDGDICYEATGTSRILIPVVKLTKMDELKTDHFSKLLITRISSDTSRNKVKIKKSRSFIKRRSTAKLIEKRSQSSTQSNPSKRKIKFSLEETDEAEYILQAFVSENTWPLTAKEWELVEKLRTRTFIEPELSLCTVSVMQPGLSKKSLTSKSATSNKKLIEKASAISLENEKPFWILTSFNDVDNLLTMRIDDRRIEQIKNIKRNIFEFDTNRFLNAQELRKDFLQANYIKWTSSLSTLDNLEQKDFSSQYNTLSESFSKSLETQENSKLSIKSKSVSQDNSLEDKSICPECNSPITLQDVLYLKAPECIHKMLPPFEINKYDIAMDKFRWLVLPEDEDRIFCSIFDKVNKWEDEYYKYLSEMDEYLEKNKSNHEFLLKWYGGIRQDSLNIMEENKMQREALIKKLKEAARGQNSPKKNK